jgi:SulP family sulfate permease
MPRVKTSAPRVRWGSEALAALVVTLGCTTEYIALGAQATSPLPGPQAAALGILLGILTAVIGIALAALGAGTRPMISGPRVASTLFLSNLVGALVADPAMAALGIRPILALAGVAVLISGLMQMVIGLRHGGSFVRKVPAPVLSGLIFGVAGLALADQVNFLVRCTLDWNIVTPVIAGLGIASHFAWRAFAQYVARKRKLALPSGLSLFVAMLVAAGAYYVALHVLPSPSPACRLIGVAGLDFANWRPVDPGLWLDLLHGVSTHALLLTIGYGLVIGFVSSLDTVIAVSSIESLTLRRGTVDRDLLAFGAVNTLLGALALLPNVGSVTRSNMAITSGAQTRWTAVMHAVLVCVALTAGVGLVAMLPKLAVAVVVIVMSLDMIDEGARTITRHAFSDARPRRLFGTAMWLFALELIATLASGQPLVGFGVGAVFGALVAWPTPRRLSIKMAESHDRDGSVVATLSGALLAYNVDSAVVEPLLARVDNANAARERAHPGVALAALAPLPVVLDLAGIVRTDLTACRALAQFAQFCAARHADVRFRVPAANASASHPMTNPMTQALPHFVPASRLHVVPAVGNPTASGAMPDPRPLAPPYS